MADWYDIRDNLKNILGLEDPKLPQQKSPFYLEAPSTVKKPKKSDMTQLPYSDDKNFQEQAKKEYIEKEKKKKAAVVPPQVTPPVPPKPSDVYAQDPTKTQFREPQNTPSGAVNEAMAIPFIDKLFREIDKKGPTAETNLEDETPPRDNIELAKRYIEENSGRLLNQPRTDLSSLMALADFWTGGKSNLAASYKPPKSNDDMMMAMLDENRRSVAQRDQAELARDKNIADAYKELVIDPKLKILDSAVGVYRGTAKLDADALRNINTLMQSGQNTLADNVSRQQTELMKETQRTKIENAKNWLKAQEIERRINIGLGRKGPDAKRDYFKKITDLQANVLAPKFMPDKRRLDPNEVDFWPPKTRARLGSLMSFADHVISARGVSSDISDDDLMAERLRVLNEIAIGFNDVTQEFSDQELRMHWDDYSSGKPGKK